MSSAQERPGGPARPAGTTEPAGGSAPGGPAGTAGRTAAGTGTPGYERVGTHRATEYEEAAEWEVSPARAGGIMLAAVLMIFTGLVTFFYGIVGVIKGAFFTSVPNYVFYFSARGRGIVDLCLGALIFAAGVCLLLGMLWARIVGVVLAVLSGVANFMFLPWYPLWSIIVIAVDVYIIWALVTGGRERRVVGG